MLLAPLKSELLGLQHLEVEVVCAGDRVEGTILLLGVASETKMEC